MDSNEGVKKFDAMREEILSLDGCKAAIEAQFTDCNELEKSKRRSFICGIKMQLDESDIAFKKLSPSAITQYPRESHLLHAFDIMLFNAFAAKADPTDEEKCMSYEAILSFWRHFSYAIPEEKAKKT